MRRAVLVTGLALAAIVAAALWYAPRSATVAAGTDPAEGNEVADVADSEATGVRAAALNAERDTLATSGDEAVTAACNAGVPAPRATPYGIDASPTLTAIGGDDADLLAAPSPPLNAADAALAAASARHLAAQGLTPPTGGARLDAIYRQNAALQAEAAGVPVNTDPARAPRLIGGMWVGEKPPQRDFRNRRGPMSPEGNG